MAKSRKELYEILSKTRRPYRSYMDPIPGYDSETVPSEKKEKPQAADIPILAAAAEVEEEPLGYNYRQGEAGSALPEKVKVSKTTDLVVNFETGVTVFFAVLILIGGAFYIGYKKGSDDILLNFSSRLQKEKDAEKIAVGDVKNSSGVKEFRRKNAVLPASSYVLRLCSYSKDGPGLTRAKRDADFAKIQKSVYHEKMDVYILYNKAAYSVCVGPARGRNDPRLEKLRKVFIRLSGPPSSRSKTPYAGSFVERVDKLGRVLQ